MQKKVEKIVIPKLNKPISRTRVCVYARTSREGIDEQHSLKAQENYYSSIYKSSPDYYLVGVFSDYGISGNNTSRPGFDAMMKQVREGNVDMIITKSISRFSRNTLFLLKIIRELRERGVALVFEKEGINTMSEQGELVMSLYGSFAEAEREQVRSNIRWSIEKSYQSGNGLFTRLYGYLKDKNKKIVINEEQAKWVRFIYDEFISGLGYQEITNKLNELCVPSPANGKWIDVTVARILTNERYKGDVFTHESFSTDSGKQKNNKGEVDRYYIEDHHVAIIDRDTWDKVQRLKKKGI